ncbi:helix-turn-helix domain-containing protein [Auritidibacter sp. NML100628]|uniref:helix-turn-helix domain-containing protein n=1 Tax=Auritidibacter sp. NML100628 TaxID=2170742 RepID=UPI000D73EE8B|nr:helix-turn-helix domain-containing protein [Auritidibacter sp. NML100628]PXA75642.1 XRE family transcriptional regulator [Auritidibacter sp. NML100628]
MKSLPIEPSDAPKALGRRLRAYREQRRLTLDQVAKATRLSKGFISRVERDLTSPSVSSLVAICQVLGVSAGEMLEAPETSHISLKEAPFIDMGGAGISEKLLTPPDQRHLQIIHAEIVPHGRGEEELYTIDCLTESVYVIEGEFVLKTFTEDFPLSAGDTLTFPGAEPHSWYNPSAETATILWVLAGNGLGFH